MALKVYISTTTFGEYDERPLKKLRGLGLEVAANPRGRKLKEAECIEAFGDIVGLVAGTEPLTAGVLESAKRLKVISRCGTGLDNVDLKAAEKLGIRVLNTPDAPTLPVAELTVGLILSLLRRINLMDSALRGGRWEKRMGNLLYGKRVGVVGFGRIGRKVAGLLSGFGVELAYSDIVRRETPVKRMDLDDLLGWADIVTLHLSGGRVIGERELGLMKRGGWIVNASRGGVIDEDALYDVLRGERLSGAAIDVFEREPYNGPLRELENVILTPHIGSYASEARVLMEEESVNNLIVGLRESGVIA